MMLSQSLKELEEHGIICRKQYDEMPVRVEYSLTEEGASLLPVLAQMSQWGGIILVDMRNIKAFVKIAICL